MKQSILYWWISLIVLSILAYFVQTNLYLHKDVAMITHFANIMLGGETYANSIFEPSPPMIMYLAMPAIFLTKLTHLTMLIAIRIYVIALALTSITISYFLNKQLFTHEIIFSYLFSYLIIFILFFLPAQQFAQREHLLLILTLPYLLITASRLENKTINPCVASVIGLMAGLGFTIKPHFLLTFLLVEAYYFYQKRNVTDWIRIETVIPISVLIVYIASIFYWYPAYYHAVLPLWLPYYAAVAHSLFLVLLYSPLIYCYAIIIFFVITAYLKKPPHINKIFLLALMGYIIAYVVPRTTWYYHILPALSIACLLAALILRQLTHLLPKITLVSIAIFLYLTPLSLYTNLLIQMTKKFFAKDDLALLINFFNSKPTFTYDLFAMTHDSIVLEYYTSAHYIGGFPFLTWEYKGYLPYAIHILTYDLTEKKPCYVIVDIPSSLEYLGTKIDYIERYSHDKDFKTAWNVYHLIKQIGRYQIYERTSPP